MANRRVEQAGGVVDGVNAVFSASTDYRPGTVTVQVNGQKVRNDEVTAPGGLNVTLANPPKAPGIVTLRFTAVT